MSDATPPRPARALREFTLNFGKGNVITVCVDPERGSSGLSMWAGDMGDGIHAFLVMEDEALETLEFLGGIIDGLRHEGRIR